MFAVPCLIRSVSPAGTVSARLGHPLLDDYLISAAGSRPSPYGPRSPSDPLSSGAAAQRTAPERHDGHDPEATADRIDEERPETATTAWLTFGSHEGRKRRDSSRGVKQSRRRKRAGQERF